LQGFQIKELEEDKEHQDLTFLTGETAMKKMILPASYWRISSDKKRVPPEFWFATLGSSFYQFSADKASPNSCRNPRCIAVSRCRSRTQGAYPQF